MDGQGDVIRTFKDHHISAMTIDYDNNLLYFRVDNEDDEPYAISRINSDFTNIRRTFIDFRTDRFRSNRPLPPFSVHDGNLFVIWENRGLLYYHIEESSSLQCINRQISTPVYSTKIIHYGRQPGTYANTCLHIIIILVHCVVQGFTGARLTMVTVMHCVYHKSLDATVSALHTKFMMPTGMSVKVSHTHYFIYTLYA